MFFVFVFKKRIKPLFKTWKRNTVKNEIPLTDFITTLNEEIEKHGINDRIEYIFVF